MKEFFVKNKKFLIMLIVQLVVLFVLVIGSLGPRNNIILDATELKHTVNAISSGCYDVVIDYDTQEQSILKVVGKVQLISKANQAAINFETVKLVGGKSKITTKAWIAFGSRVKDLKVNVSNNKEKLATIKQVTFRENLIWRVTRVLKWMFIFVVIDVFCLLLFVESKYTLSLNKKYVLLTLITICTFSCMPVLYKNTIKGDDLLFHLSRIASLTEGLRAGQFPLRIQSEMLNGYGFTTPLFYCDIFLYIPAVLHWMCIPLEVAYKTYIVLVNVSTCLVTYWVFKKLVYNDKLAVLGSGLYVLGAYRILNIYRRAAVGEYTAMIFFPLVVYGFYKVLSFEDEYRPKLKDYIAIIIGLSGIILSHVLSCEMVAGFILIVCLIFIKKVLRKNTFVALAKAAIATVVLNLWMLVPFLQSMQMELRITNNEINKIQNKGLTLYNIFSIFFVGHCSAEERVKVASVGITLIIGILVYIYFKIKYGKQSGKLYKLGEATFVLGTIAIVFSTKYFPWDSIQAYSGSLARVVCTLQFPWRFLAVATVMFTFSTLIMLSALIEKKEHILVNGIIALVAVLGVITTGFFYLDNGLFSTTVVVNTFEDVGTGCIGRGEYLPVGTNKKQLLGKRQVSTGENVAYTEYSYKKGITQISCANKSNKKSSITIPLLKYDNYQAVDVGTGKRLEINTGKNGLVKIVLPENYSGKIEVRYVSPTSWKIAIIISSITWLGGILVFWMERKRTTI